MSILDEVRAPIRNFSRRYESRFGCGKLPGAVSCTSNQHHVFRIEIILQELILLSTRSVKQLKRHELVIETMEDKGLLL